MQADRTIASIWFEALGASERSRNYGAISMSARSQKERPLQLAPGLKPYYVNAPKGITCQPRADA
jgi:hypothetical protein